MKKLYIKFPFSLLIMLLIASCATEKHSVTEPSQNIISGIKPGNIRGNILEIDTFDLKIIPPSSGVQFYKEGIVFLSPAKIEEKMLPKHLSFGNVKAYYAMIYEGVPVNYTVFSPSMPFSYPCEAITFSSDFNTMYFTKISDTDGKEKIYKAVYSSGLNMQPGWSSDNNPLSFCTGNSIYTDPALSADGRQMVFASDKTGSTGGMDLFITVKEGDKWTEPHNLGNSINSKDNELFPFLDKKMNLFFSSDRKTGFGGYDIFVCKYNGKGWNKPEHLPSLINSVDDDLAFTINPKDGKSAFYTIKRKSGKEGSQLYRVTINTNVGADRTKDLSAVLYGMATSNLIALEAQPSAETAIASEKRESKEAIKDTISKPGTIITAEVKKETKDITPPVAAVTVPEKMVATNTAVVTKPEESEVETKETAKAVTANEAIENKDAVVYRVQILTTGKSKPGYTIPIANKNYSTYEYFYKDAYRIAIGEFSKLADAKKFQNVCRQNGFPQAFVVAFKNNLRSTDPELFK